MDQAKAPRETVKMRFTGTLTNGEKRVDIPIPFVSKSMWEGYLTFKQEANNGSKKPSGVAEVPLHWAAILLEYGGFFELVEKMTPELKADLKASKELYLEQQADLASKEKALMGA